MATEAQIRANRQNARKSTGPKTAEGKATASQNAVKHGLFAESVVTGETEAEYAAFHGELLAELAPRGVVELLLAERVVSLWWRLIRAERMQNQALDDMMEKCVTNLLPRSMHGMECHAMGVPLGDEKCLVSYLPLGRVTRLDWASKKVLERMIMYERRIELSLHRTMNELKSHKKIRRSECEDAEKEQAAPNEAILKAFDPSALNRTTCDDPHTRLRERQTREYWDRVLMQQIEAEERSNLEKQSQFPMDEATARAILKIAYGDNPDDEAGENRAEQTQSCACDLPGGAEKMEESAAEAAG